MVEDLIFDLEGTMSIDVYTVPVRLAVDIRYCSWLKNDWQWPFYAFAALEKGLCVTPPTMPIQVTSATMSHLSQRLPIAKRKVEIARLPGDGEQRIDGCSLDELYCSDYLWVWNPGSSVRIDTEGQYPEDCSDG